MNDTDSPDRVPLDRPPVPRFNPLPDLPDLPELPRGAAPAPTPSVPIPAPPPVPSLPAPRVMIDLPRPSPTVSIDPPRPAPRPLPAPPKPAETPPTVASTPAPQGRWVGEALAALVRPTKSKATVLAAAGSLVAGAFVLQVLVGTGGPTAPTTRTTHPEVTQNAAEPPPTPDERCETKPAPNVDDAPSWPKDGPFLLSDADTGRFGEQANPFAVRVTTAGGSVPPPPDTSRADLTMHLPSMPAPPNPNILTVGAEAPVVPIPVLPAEGPMPPAIPGGLPAIPAPAPIPVPFPATIPVPQPTPEVAKPIVPTPPTEAAKPVAPPALPPKPIELPPKPPEPAVKTTQVEPMSPGLPSGLGFKIDPDPPAPSRTPPPVPTLPAPTPSLPVAPAPVAPAPTPVPVFGIVETPAQPRLPTPPTPAAEARTDFDVDLHPAQAGQTYEAVSKQHYADAKYADALRTFNKGRDPARDEVQIPPTYVLRKLAAGGRAPAANVNPSNPIAPASGEAWAPPATLGGAKTVAAGRTYTVTQDGTTFRDLAGTLLNDRTKYRRISDLNPTIDANAKLQKGDKVAVP